MFDFADFLRPISPSVSAAIDGYYALEELEVPVIPDAPDLPTGEDVRRAGASVGKAVVISTTIGVLAYFYAQR